MPIAPLFLDISTKDRGVFLCMFLADLIDFETKDFI